jgi:hypothetical protein
MTQKTAAQNIRNGLKSSTENEMIEKFKRKQVHGQLYRTLTEYQLIEKYLCTVLCSSGLKGETESWIIAAQEQCNTCYH